MTEVSEVKTLTSILGPKLGQRARRISEAIVMGEALYKMAKTLHDKRVTKRTFRISVNSTDALYSDIHDWFVTQIPSEQRKSLFVRSPHESQYCAPTSEFEQKPDRKRLAFFYDGSLRQSVMIGGHEVDIWIESPQIHSSAVRNAEWNTSKIYLETKSAAGRDAIIAWLDEMNQSRAPETGPRLYLANRWGGWERQENERPRPLSSVILGTGIRESIISDLRKFLDDEEIYLRLGLPWHRGYLLYGPPGTGKTTIARALAAHFALDAYYLPLSDLSQDTDLLGLVAQVKSRALLIIEDVDIVHAAKSRDDSESVGISLSGLLNALDGVTTPHGLITILTTNDRDVLDPALIRPGRTDLEVEISYLTNEQANRLLMALTGAETAPTPNVDGKDVSPATIVGILKQHLDDPQTAMDAVMHRYP